MSSDPKQTVLEMAYGSHSVLGLALRDPAFEPILKQIRFVTAFQNEFNASATVDRHGMNIVSVDEHCLIELTTMFGMCLQIPQVRQFLSIKGRSQHEILELLVGASLDFIVWHEIFHHVLGHVRYLHARGICGLSERSSLDFAAQTKNPLPRPSSYDLRACELSADTQAILMIWRFQRILRKHQDSRYYRLKRKEMLKLVSFSVMVTFAVIANGEPMMEMYELGLNQDGSESDETFDRSRIYPHPTVRMMQVDAQLERRSKLSWFYRDRRATLEALGVVASLGKTGVLPHEILYPILKEQQLLLISGRRIFEHWVQIAPEVEKYGLELP